MIYQRCHRNVVGIPGCQYERYVYPAVFVQLHLFVKRRYVFSVKSAGNVARRVRHRAFGAERNNLVKPYFDRRVAYRVKHRDTGNRVNALFRGF